MSTHEIVRILLPFEDKLLLANMQDTSNPSRFQYFIEFSNGYINTFSTEKHEISSHVFSLTDDWQETDKWEEETFGATELAKSIGVHLETHFARIKEYEEPFAITVGGSQFVVQPVTPEKETIFMIYQDGSYSCNMHVNDDTEWEVLDSVTVFDKGLVRAIGNAIESILS